MKAETTSTYERYSLIRDKKKMLDTDVAKSAGIAQSTLSDWKSGRSMPKYDKVKKIAEAMGIPVSKIYE